MGAAVGSDLGLAAETASATSPIEVGAPRRTAPGVVELVVDGTPITFTSDDVDLAPRPEVAAALFALVGAVLDRPVRLAAPVDPSFARGVGLLGRTVDGWWGVRPGRLPTQRPTCRVRRARRSALFFSCGLDSFHALLTDRVRVDDLVFVHGFDVARHDEARAEALERRVRAVAEARGLGAIVIRTDLRLHPTFRQVVWDRSHGGAMAAVAHLLSDRCGTAVLAASPAYGADLPWGSHWRIDRRWSAPHVRLVPTGMHRIRGEKVADLAGHPLVDQHLQVCWERKTEPGNCSTCRKCVLTMALLDHHRGLTSSRTFDPPVPLPELVDALPGSPLYGRSLEPIAAAGGPLGAAMRAYLDRGVDPSPRTSWPRRVADALRLP